MRVADDNVRAELGQLGHPGEAAFVNLVPEHHRAPGPHGQGDHARQQVHGEIRPRRRLDLRQQVRGEGLGDDEFLPLADKGGVAVVFDLHAELGEGTVDEVEVVGQGVFHPHLAAGDGAEGEEGDDLVVVGVEGENAALERLHPGDGQLARADPRDFRAHRIERGAEILHVRLARGVEQHRLALGEHGGHDEVLRGGDRHIVRPVARALEPALERQLQVAACPEPGRGVVGDFRAEFPEDLQVRVELADAERATLGIGRQREPLHALQERGEKQDGRAHAGRQFAVEAAGVKACMDEGDRADGAVPRDERALLGEEVHELLDVGDVRHMVQHDLGVGQQRRAEEGQDGILVARRRDGAAQGFAAVDDEIGHEKA